MPALGEGDDLFFNTRDDTHTGVWVLPGVAAIGFGHPSLPLDPDQLFSQAAPSDGTGSTFGEGLAFASNGDLLVVDRSGDRVLTSSPPFNSTSVLITGLDKPFGIDVDSTGDIFVANGGTRKVERYDPAGTFLGTYISFSPPSSPISSNSAPQTIFMWSYLRQAAG